MNIVFSASGTGTMDAEDRRAATFAIQRYNDLNGTTLLTDTAPNIRASYITLLAAQLLDYHTQRIAESKTLDATIKAGLTDAQAKEILGAVVDRLITNKSTYTDILNDIITP